MARGGDVRLGARVPTGHRGVLRDGLVHHRERVVRARRRRRGGGRDTETRLERLARGVDAAGDVSLPGRRASRRATLPREAVSGREGLERHSAV